MTLRRVTEAAEFPVSLDEAIDHLRLEGVPGHEDRITRALAAATGMIEKETGRVLVSQHWEKRLDAFPANGGAIELAKPPVTAVVSVKYFDIDGALQTLAPDALELDPQSETAWLMPAFGYVWPETLAKPNAVQVLFTAGAAASGVVPPDLRAAVLMLMEHFFSNTSAVSDRTYTEVPMAVQTIIDLNRVMRFA